MQGKQSNGIASCHRHRWEDTQNIYNSYEIYNFPAYGILNLAQVDGSTRSSVGAAYPKPMTQSNDKIIYINI
jgi:hypothetical protein